MILRPAGIHEAARAGLVDRVRTLIDAGTPVDAPDATRRTALHHAVAGGQDAVARLLIERGADVNAKDGPGYYPLMLAGDNAKLARLLLAAGADPNAAWGEGRTVFHFLLPSGNLEVLSALIDAGADLTAKADDGKGALDYAKSAAPKVRALLKERMGTPPTPTDLAIVRVRAELKRLPALSAEETFAACAARLGALFNRTPAPWRRRKGIVYFHDVSIAKYLAPHYGEQPSGAAQAPRQLNRLLERLQDDVRAQGYTLVYVQAIPDEDDRLPLILQPTKEKYVAVLAAGTNGINYGHTNEAVISWLMSAERANPFEIAGCGLDFVDARFTTDLVDADDLARRMIAFSPDIVNQAGDPMRRLSAEKQVAALAEDIKSSRSFSLWWD